MLQLLYIDSHEAFRKELTERLRAEGFTVYETAALGNASACLEICYFDLILIDPRHLSGDGYEFCGELRKNDREILILMLSEQPVAADIRKGYWAGADEYSVKSMDFDELLLRIRALLRRADKTQTSVLRSRRLMLDQRSMTVEYDGIPITLAPKEFQLLYLLLSHPGMVFTRVQLLDELWGPDSESGLRTVNTHIARLKKHTEPIREVSITAVRGVGYKAVWNQS